jgi:hypothetical protein
MDFLRARDDKYPDSRFEFGSRDDSAHSCFIGQKSLHRRGRQVKLTLYFSFLIDL